MVASIFGLVEGVGLTDVLAGRAEFEDVAQPVGLDGNLRVLGAGKLPRTVGGARLGTDARPPAPPGGGRHRHHRCSPASAGHGRCGAGAQCGRGMIVASVGKTTVETLQRAIQNLDRAGARCLGVVINRVPVRGRGKGYDDYRSRATTTHLGCVRDGSARFAPRNPGSRGRRTSRRLLRSRRPRPDRRRVGRAGGPPFLGGSPGCGCRRLGGGGRPHDEMLIGELTVEGLHTLDDHVRLDVPFTGHVADDYAHTRRSVDVLPDGTIRSPTSRRP